MSQTAADFDDRVLPGVEVSQWVLSMPFDLRYRLAYDRKPRTPVLGDFEDADGDGVLAGRPFCGRPRRLSPDRPGG